MTPATLLIPVILGAALVYAALTGHLTQEQLAAGGLLLLVPGADRYAPLLRQLLRLGPAQPALPSRDLTTDEIRSFIEAAALAAYERYGDACSWRTVGGGQMPRWADQHERLRLCWREAARGALGLQPGVNPGELAPVVPVILPATPPADPLPAVDIEAAIESTWLSYDRERKQSGDESYTWKKYIRAAFDGQLGVAPTPPVRSTPPSPPPIALLLLLLPLLGSLVWGCSPALRGALLACAAAEVSPAVSTAAELALHQGEGWQEALARLVLSAGECAVRAAVRAVADRPPAAQPMGLMAAGAGVSPQEVQARAQSWIKGRR